MVDLNIDNMPIAILRVNRDHVIIYSNQECLNLFGHTELNGNKLEILIPEQYRERHLQQSELYWSNPDKKPLGFARDLPGLKKNGNIIFVEVGLYPLSDGTLLVLLIDVTIRLSKSIDSSLQHLNEKLNQLLSSIEDSPKLL